MKTVNFENVEHSCVDFEYLGQDEEGADHFQFLEGDFKDRYVSINNVMFSEDDTIQYSINSDGELTEEFKTEVYNMFMFNLISSIKMAKKAEQPVETTTESGIILP